MGLSRRLGLLCTWCWWALALLLLPATSAAQGMGSAGAANGRIEGRYKILPLPYINYSRSLGLTVGALPMVMFNPVERDTISPSSVAGMLAMYTTNDSWFVVGFAQMFFAQDRWRFTGAGGTGAVNFQFYLDNPIGKWVPYNTSADFVYLEGQRRIIKNLFGGLTLRLHTLS